MRKILSIAALLLLLVSPAYAQQIFGNPIKPVATTVAAGSLIAKATSGFMYGFSATSGASAGYLMILDSATVPADGTVTPAYCYVMAANSTVSVSFIENPAAFVNGITFVYSTTGCFNKTISNTAYVSTQIR